MDFRKSYCLAILLSAGAAPALQAQTRRVVTYIEDVQDERKSTRWTLTEWLRIKERMKMMDVWLAMFSDPKKDKFAPELNLQYGQSRGLSRLSYGDAADFNDSTSVSSETDHRREQGRLQFWFTNLVSSTTGLRTLNIDLGIEANFSNRFMVEQQTLTPPTGTAITTATDKMQWSGANLRLFGANVQDSFLIGKIGKFNRDSGFTDSPFASSSGTYYGGEMALYFLSFLGAEGEYLALKPQLGEGERAQASNADYGAFLEIYNVRFLYSIYDHQWSQDSQGLRLDTRETWAHADFPTLLLTSTSKGFSLVFSGYPFKRSIRSWAEQLILPSLLIALPGLMDPHFAKSVILLIQHNPDGALGFVINRPMPLSLRDPAFQNRYQIPNHVPVWMGGPIGSNQGLVIHNQGGDNAATTASGVVRVSSSEEAVEGLVQHMENITANGQQKGAPLLPYRFVIGYAGWGAKQLDLELKSGAWYQKPLDERLMFNTPWQEIWPSAIAELGVHPLDIAPNVQSYMN